MIPKKIHYFWFGGNAKTKLALECIESWKKYCPDYEIIEWNEENYDIHKNKYMEQAYNSKRWGFVSDYARLDVIYEHGGIYFDTDVEVIRTLDDLLCDGGFIGFEKNPDSKKQKYYVNTGQGFGATKHHPIIKKMKDMYETLSFCEDGNENLTTCPYYNTEVLTKLGLKQDNTYQSLNDFKVYPSDYFCPVNWKTKELNKSVNTYSIHYFNASWLSDLEKKKRKRKRTLDYMIHLPNMIFMKIIGKEMYDKLKQFIKG